MVVFHLNRHIRVSVTGGIGTGTSFAGKAVSLPQYAGTFRLFYDARQFGKSGRDGSNQSAGRHTVQGERDQKHNFHFRQRKRLYTNIAG